MTAVPPRPAAPECPTPCDDDCDVACHEEHQPVWKREHASDHHAAPDATAGDELREALVRPIRELADAYGRWPFRVDPLKVTRRLDLLADAVLALPALRDVLAERDRLRETVQRVRGLADTLGEEAMSRPKIERAAASLRIYEALDAS